MSLYDRFATQLEGSTLALILLVLVLIAAAHAGLRWWVQRKSRRDLAVAMALPPDERDTRLWMTRGLKQLIPPTALLIWVHGIYIALGLLLPAAAATAAWAQPWRAALAWGYGIGVVVAIVWLLLRIGGLIERFLLSLAARSEATWDDVLLPLAGRAIRNALPLLALILGAPALSVSPDTAEIIGNATSLLLIAVIASILLQSVNTGSAYLLKQYPIDVQQNLQARAIRTQIMVLKKVAVAVIGIFTLASMLMVFESVREFGASILASAGIAGVIIGFAAQRSIATLLAGFQIALTQPIRVDDVVIVEGEWGRIEDITLTYVVVRVWDLRRLVVPITYFIEQPFQNWTRSSADLLGTVFLYVDYTIPVDAMRAELTRILQGSSNWDGKVNVLQVTDAKERTMELRALASAADASLAFSLRCEIREQLIAFVQREYPECLPRLRATLEAADTPQGRAGAASAPPLAPTRSA